MLTIFCALIAILGGFAYVRFSAYYTASAKFRSAILKELDVLYPIITQWPKSEDAFFRAAFPNLQTAVAEFRHFVPWYRRRAFDNAWLCYYSAYPKQTKEQIYHHYMASFDPHIDTQQIATARRDKTFHDNVSSLLSFAKNS